MARQFRQRRLQLPQGWQHLGQQPFARFGRHHGPGAAIEQPDGQATLQPFEGMTQGRGGDPELEGGLAETAVTGDGGKHGQLGEIGAGEDHGRYAEKGGHKGYAMGRRETIGGNEGVVIKLLRVSRVRWITPKVYMLKKSQHGDSSVI